MDVAPVRPWRTWPRHLLALALTFGILPYYYGRWLIFALQGVNDVRLAGLVAGAVAVLIPLTWGLRPPLRGLGTLVGWVVVYCGLVAWVAGPQMPLDRKSVV